MAHNNEDMTEEVANKEKKDNNHPSTMDHENVKKGKEQDGHEAADDACSEGGRGSHHCLKR